MEDLSGLPRDHLGLDVLPPETCWELLAGSPIGRVAFVDAGDPVVFPVTHAVVGRRVVFLSEVGTKLAAASENRHVAFEVDAWDPAHRSGWSVLVRGVADVVYEDSAVAELESLRLEPWADGVQQGTWIQIRPDEVTGRRLHRPA